jgi:hypothetical protein
MIPEVFIPSFSAILALSYVRLAGSTERKLRSTLRSALPRRRD